MQNSLTGLDVEPILDRIHKNYEGNGQFNLCISEVHSDMHSYHNYKCPRKCEIWSGSVSVWYKSRLNPSIWMIIGGATGPNLTFSHIGPVVCATGHWPYRTFCHMTGATRPKQGYS